MYRAHGYQTIKQPHRSIVSVNTLTYNYVTCKDREYQLAVKPAKLFTRYGCIHVSYKMSAKSVHRTSKCELYIQANRHNLGGRISLIGDAEIGQWHHKKISVTNYWRRLGHPIVRKSFFFFFLRQRRRRGGRFGVHSISKLLLVQIRNWAQ